MQSHDDTEGRVYGQVCPIARTLDLLGERWTLLIVRDLFFGRTRFSEFMAHAPGMPARMLSMRLKKLERVGLVRRTVYSEHPLRAEYHLTESGESLRPVVVAIADWGMNHTLDVGERRMVRTKLKRYGIG